MSPQCSATIETSISSWALSRRRPLASLTSLPATSSLPSPALTLRTNSRADLCVAYTESSRRHPHRRRRRPCHCAILSSTHRNGMFAVIGRASRASTPPCHQPRAPCNRQRHHAGLPLPSHHHVSSAQAAQPVTDLLSPHPPPAAGVARAPAHAPAVLAIGRQIWPRGSRSSGAHHGRRRLTTTATAIPPPAAFSSSASIGAWRTRIR